MGLLSDQSGEEEDDELLPGIRVTGLDDLADSDDELVYELDDWSDRDRSVLSDRLALLGAGHRWEGTTLVVAATDEAWIEQILDQVEDELSLLPDPDVEQVAYELEGWTDEQRDALSAALTDEAVPHSIEGDELFVNEIDEQRTDELVERFVNPDAELADPGQEVAHEVMGELFLAADRLARDPRDHEGTLSLIDAARMAGAGTPPYGLDARWWRDIVAEAVALQLLVEQTASDDDEIMAVAERLRDGLRPYI